MEMKKVLMLLLAVILLPASFPFFTLRCKGSPETVLCVDPKTTKVAVACNFTINVNITDVTNFTGYEFKLYWNKTLLNAIATNDTPPPQWTQSVILGPGLEPNYNATHGRYFRGCMSLPCTEVTGNFILASLTFNATAKGNCTLALRDTRIAGYECEPISHTVEDGFVRVLFVPGDIAPEFGIVDIMDILVVGVAFGSRPGDPNWNPTADLYPVCIGDQVIDIMDILVIAVDFGKEDC